MAQLSRRGIRDARVLGAIGEVPRHRFVPEELIEAAYDDSALAIGEGQTISQPYVVALMTQALELRPVERVLEVGTGSGYSAAVVSRLVGEVYSVERIPTLAARAAKTLAELGFTNVHLRVGDGTEGWKEHAPFDAIAVTAGGPRIPEPLLWQLAEGGRLVIPIGPTESQTLMRITRRADGRFVREDLGAVRFVPLVAPSPRGRGKG